MNIDRATAIQARMKRPKLEAQPPVRVERVVRRFRCTASRFRLDDPPRNPFLMRIEDFGPGKTTILTFEFDAADESECRRLFKEAQEQGISNVVGFTLDKVEEITPNGGTEPPPTNQKPI